jgi:hypothetical protein
MPQLQSLVLTDRTPVTPVNLTFTPREISADGVGKVANNTGTPLGERIVSVSMRKRGARYKGEVRLTLPVVQTETINGVSRPVVVRTAYLTLNADFSEASSQQERDDAIGLMASALGTGKVLVNDALVKCESVY